MNYLPRPESMPLPLYLALISDQYSTNLKDHWSKFSVDLQERYRNNHISVTTLPKSPRQRILLARHQHEMTLNALDNWWRMNGHVVHTILENHAPSGDMIETRLGFEFNGTYVHGCVDRQVDHQSTEEEPNAMQDWKYVKVGSLFYDKIDHHRQLNVLDRIWRENGRPTGSLQNIYLFRDWDAKYVKEGKDYPSTPYLNNTVPIMEGYIVEDYLRERIHLHFSHNETPSIDLPYCNDKELWRDLPLFRVIKKKEDGSLQARSKFVANSRIEAEDWISNNLAKIRTKEEAKKGIIPQVQIIQKKSIARYCPMCPCLQFCEQGQMEISQSEPEPETEEEP